MKRNQKWIIVALSFRINSTCDVVWADGHFSCCWTSVSRRCSTP
uniref:Uncharacterized protein n=1 Tax=Rhizophora mucronata TaxID=61149 RepID=A0A2P2M0V5_RHIMU